MRDMSGILPACGWTSVVQRMQEPVNRTQEKTARITLKTSVLMLLSRSS